VKVLVQEVENEGLASLLGKRITLFCGVYIYTGDLVGVNETCVKLSNPAIVYETGELTLGLWKDAQKLPKDWYVSTQAIESFGELK
jgi:hypothetical protein